MTVPKLDGRLASALGFLRKDAKLIDVGSDHAYLPITCVKKGLCREAIAADINEGPLAKAAAHVAAYGLNGQIEVVRTDGLEGIALDGKCDVTIFGMGGELIVRILRDALPRMGEDVRLILSPMTHQPDVRRFLLGNGFSIFGETLSEAEGKIYQTIAAERGGEKQTYTLAEYVLGKKNMEEKSALFCRYAAERRIVWEKVRDQKRSAGVDASEEEILLAALSALGIERNRES